MDFYQDPHDWYPSQASMSHQNFSDLLPKTNSILHTIKTHQVVILDSSTYSSKTYFIPQILFTGGFVECGWSIGVVFPTRNAAVSKSRLIINQLGSNRGVGLSIDWFENVTYKSDVQIFTPESLLAEIKNAPLLDTKERGYSAIYVDSFPASGIKGELLLSFLSQIVDSRPDFKLVIGTYYNDCVSELLTFFNGSSNEDFEGFSPLNLKKAVVLNLDIVKGEDVIVKHLPIIPDDPLEKALDLIEHIHINEEKGNILVFMPSSNDCIDAQKILIDRRIPNLIIFAGENVVYSSSTGARYVYFVSSIYQCDRMMRDIKYVIDTGLKSCREYDSKKQFTYMKNCRITENEATIRTAAGTQYPSGKGIVYRMYPPNTFNETPDYSNIQDIQEILLPMKLMGISNFKSFKFFRIPSIRSLSAGLVQLSDMGIISLSGSLTPNIGSKIDNFIFLPLCFARFLIASFEYGCTSEAISIISMLSLNIKFRYGESRVREGDLCSAANFYKHFISFPDPELKLKIAQVKRMRYQLSTRCELIGRIQSTRQTDKIIQAIVTGFFHNAAVFNVQRQAYIHLITGELLYVHPQSVLKDLDMILHTHYVVFGSVEVTDKPYMKNITVVDDPSIFTEIAPNIFTGILGDLPSSRRQKPIRVLDESILPSSLIHLANTMNYFK